MSMGSIKASTPTRGGEAADRVGVFDGRVPPPDAGRLRQVLAVLQLLVELEQEDGGRLPRALRGHAVGETESPH